MSLAIWLTASVIVLTAVPAQQRADDAGSDREASATAEARPAPVWALVHQLDLSDDQLEQVRLIRLDQQRQVEQWRRDLATLRAKALDARREGDTDTALAAARRLNRLRTEPPTDDADFLRRIRKVLTADQWTQLQQAIRERDRLLHQRRRPQIR